MTRSYPKIAALVGRGVPAEPRLTEDGSPYPRINDRNSSSGIPSTLFTTAFARRMATAVLTLALIVVGSTRALAAPPPAKLKIAVVQLADSAGLDATRHHLVDFIRQAAERGARVVVFPEGALSIPGGASAAEKDAAIAALRTAARQKDIYVITGMNVFAGAEPKAVNSMLVIGPDGADVFSYTKLYSVHTAPMPATFLIDGIACSGILCADRWLRGVEELPIQQGAQINFELSGNFAAEWVPAYQWYWYVPRALRNSAWVVFSNTANSPGTPSGKGKNHGHGAIVAPDGRLLAAAREDTETMIVGEIDVSAATRAAAQARAAHPVLRQFWDAGVRLQTGEKLPAPPLTPLRSPEVEVTLAAATISGDLNAMKRAVAEAHAKAADVIAFPARATAESDLPALQTAAREAGITVVVGAAHRVGGLEYNSAFVIGPDGAIQTRYDQLSAHQPYGTGTDPRTMWFSVKGVPAIVTLERDALWTEIAELAAVAGARLIVHLDRHADMSDEGRLLRLQLWSNHASFLTFTATVSPAEAILWDDLRGMEEISAEAKGRPRPDTGAVEVYSPWSANLVVRSTAAAPLIVATRKIRGAVNPHHPNQTSRYNPQMEPWYRIGAQLIHPQ